MRVGVTLPQFRHDAEPALETAQRAETTGLDGVFVFDHLWPLGRPDRPALHSAILLGALTAETRRVTLGTLVARVGLLPDAVLVHTLQSLDRMAPGRFLAAVGTGDRANRDENLAYGVPFPPAAERVARLIGCVRRLREVGVRTWVGGLSPAVLRAATEADGWNGWGLSPSDFADHVARLRAQPGARPELEVTWAGQVLVGGTTDAVQTKIERFGPRPGVVVGTVADLVTHLQTVRDMGASWAVCAPIDVGLDPAAVDLVADAAAVVRG